MKKPKPETPNVPKDKAQGDVKPVRYERPGERPKPTPKPPKKK